MKKLPYNIDDYELIREKDYYFVDKTRYIKYLEQWCNFNQLARPHGMGGSLFLSMMMSYYDIANKDRFQELFGNLEIGRNPTDRPNSCLVLKLDLANVPFTGDDFSERFSQYCHGQFVDFLERYKDYFGKENIDRILSIKEPGLTIVYLSDLGRLERYHYRMALFVDNFDNLSNIAQAAKEKDVETIIYNCLWYYIHFLKCYKGTFWRIFINGVLPAFYNDLTNGFDIMDWISLYPKFDEIVGLSEEELRGMLEYYYKEGKIQDDIESILATLKSWYGNFCFSEESYEKGSLVYNTDMVMRYVNHLIETDMPP